MAKSLARETISRLGSRGWLPNLVVGGAFLLMSPVIGVIMQHPRMAIVSAAIGATVLVWVVAWAAYRSVPADVGSTVASDSGSPIDPERPANTPQSADIASPVTSPTGGAKAAAPEAGSRLASPSQPPAQSTSVSHSPGANVYQAGRDVVISQPATPGGQRIQSLTLEVRLTCSVKDGHGKLPPDEVPFVPIGEANAYLDGPAGRQRLAFASPVRFRRLADNRILVVNRFSLDPAGDLIGQPIRALANFEKIIVPVITIVWGSEFERFTLLELSLSLNGGDSAYYSWPYDQTFQQGPVFTVAFGGLRRQLIGGSPE